MSNANQPGAAWGGPGDPFVLVAGHLVSPEDGFGEIGRMANGDLRRPGRIEAGTGGLFGGVQAIITRFNGLPTIQARRANGTEAIPTAVLNGQQLGAFSGGGHDGVSFAVGATIGIIAAENWAVGAHGTILFLSTTPVGSVTAVRRWQVQASGNFVAATDNAFDIGQAGASRPRNVHIASGLFLEQFDAAAVSEGIIDSGGAGFRLLRVPN